MENPRTAIVRRDTKETQIQMELSLDGVGKGEISTGIPFLDHMLVLFPGTDSLTFPSKPKETFR